MHGRIHIGLLKVHGRFGIGPPQVFHPICPGRFPQLGNSVYHSCHAVLFERVCLICEKIQEVQGNIGFLLRFPLGFAIRRHTVYWTFKVSRGPTYIGMPNLWYFLLKGDSMVWWHHMGLNRMHPDRSSCLNLSVNGSIGWQISEDSCLAFSKKKIRALPCTMPPPSIWNCVSG